MDRLSDVIKWLEQIKTSYGDLPVLKEECEEKGTYRYNLCHYKSKHSL